MERHTERVLLFGLLAYALAATAVYLEDRHLPQGEIAQASLPPVGSGLETLGVLEGDETGLDPDLQAELDELRLHARLLSQRLGAAERAHEGLRNAYDACTEDLAALRASAPPPGP